MEKKLKKNMKKNFPYIISVCFYIKEIILNNHKSLESYNII